MARFAAQLLGVIVILQALPTAAVEIIHVPGGVPNLSSAISQIDDGGVIEMANGTYDSPAGGWLFGDLGKSFSIRAAAGATVRLDGNSNYPVFRLQNGVLDLDDQVTFEGVVFSNGLSTLNGVAGGVSISRAAAVFVDCVFDSNGSNATITGGGGAVVFEQSVVSFVRCAWTDNWARNEGAGLKVGSESTVAVHDSTFTGNAVNLPGHRTTAAGGGIHVGNADLFVSNTRFESNEAGYVGGGLYAIGSWLDPVSVPRSVIDVANCTFVDNVAAPDAGVTPPAPTEGGGVHAEDQTTIRIFNSRFLTNSAENGGGLNLYRAVVEVEGSVFRGNRATGIGSSRGFGGAISAISNDTSADGTTNRPSAHLTVSGSLFEARFGGVTSGGQSAAGIFASGDTNRQYGNSGVIPDPNLSLNRATVEIRNSVFSDCDVLDNGVKSGVGGGINVSLVDLLATGLVMINNDATGATSQGGALRGIVESQASVSGTIFAGNSVQRFGGAIFVQGIHVEISDSIVVENQDGDQLYGAAIFSAPDTSTGVSITGFVESSIISNTSDLGLLIFDDDRQGTPTTPINDVRYNDNTLFDRSQGAQLYRDPLNGGSKTVSELNSLVINRTGGTPSTTKSQSNNLDPGSAPEAAAIVAAPPTVLPLAAAGDGVGGTDSFIGYAWSGGSATLDGFSVSGNTGLDSAGVGIHTLAVGGTNDSATITNGSAPSASFTASPIAITSGQSADLQWSIAAGSFLGVAIDHGVSIPSNPSGSVTVWPTVTTTYHLLMRAEEGSDYLEATVYVDEIPPETLFSDGFESGDPSVWSAVTP